MTGLGAALQNLGVAVMTPLLPKLAEFIGMIKAGIISVKEFLFNTGILTRDLTIQSEATKELVQAEAELFKARVAQEAFEAHTSGGAPDPGNRLKLAKERVKNINAQIRANEMLAKIQERQARIQDEHTKKMRARGEAEDIINNAIKTAQEETAQLTLLVKAKTEAERAGITSTLEFSEAFATLGEEGEILKQKLKEITEKNFNLEKSLKDTGDEVTEFTPLMENFVNTARSMGSSLEQTFIDTISGTKSALQGFKDMSRQLVEEILRIYIRMSVINPIIRSIFKGQAGFTEDFANTNFPTADGSTVFSNALNLGKRAIGMGKAGGGGVSRRQPVIVGERGPEMFIPNVGGRIVPNGSLSSGRGSTIINQSLNFTTGIQNTVRAEVMNMMPIIQNATLQAVVDQKRRGGSFGQGMS